MKWIMKWMINEWCCINHHPFNCIWLGLEYVWTLRPSALKRYLKKSSLKSFFFQRPLSFRLLFFSKTFVVYMKRSFIWKTFLGLPIVLSSVGLGGANEGKTKPSLIFLVFSHAITKVAFAEFKAYATYRQWIGNITYRLKSKLKLRGDLDQDSSRSNPIC